MQDSMHIFVTGPSGNTFKMYCGVTELIGQVLARCKEIEGEPARNAVFFFAGKVLQENRALEDYGIQIGTTLKMLLPRKAGSHS